MRLKLFAFLADRQGATMIEYALIAALVSVAAVVILGSLGGSISNVFTSVNSNMAV
jgi:pilus assembly protein Flp/PilA